jgi:hypothetical protein
MFMRLAPVFLFLLILFLCSVPVSAQTISMANPGGIAERDVLVYYSNGTLHGLYNSSSVITLDSGQDYIFAMKPLSTNPLEDPGDWLTETAFPFIQSNIIALLFIGFFIGMVFRRV